jgi:hypothetical protein
LGCLASARRSDNLCSRHTGETTAAAEDTPIRGPEELIDAIADEVEARFDDLSPGEGWSVVIAEIERRCAADDPEALACREWLVKEVEEARARGDLPDEIEDVGGDAGVLVPAYLSLYWRNLHASDVPDALEKAGHDIANESEDYLRAQE